MVNIEERQPGYSLAVKLKETQNDVNKVSSFGKFLGISPLSTESRSWYTGMIGELRVGSKLNSLKDEGWKVFHSVPIGEKGSDIDHVLISPTGKIFTINTKRHPGKKVKYYSKKMYINGQPSDHLRNSVYEMNRVKKAVESHGVNEAFVRSVCHCFRGCKRSVICG